MTRPAVMDRPLLAASVTSVAGGGGGGHLHAFEHGGDLGLRLRLRREVFWQRLWETLPHASVSECVCARECVLAASGCSADNLRTLASAGTPPQCSAAACMHAECGATNGPSAAKGKAHLAAPS